MVTSKYQPVVNTQTTRQICEIVVLNRNSSGENDLELMLPSKIFNKKSKSIDSSQKTRLMQRVNSSKDCITGGKGKMMSYSKKSVDLTNLDMDSKDSGSEMNSPYKKEESSSQKETSAEKNKNRSEKRFKELASQ